MKRLELRSIQEILYAHGFIYSKNHFYNKGPVVVDNYINLTANLAVEVSRTSSSYKLWRTKDYNIGWGSMKLLSHLLLESTDLSVLDTQLSMLC